MKFEPLVNVYNRLKETNQTIKETEQKLYMSFLKGEFNFTFNLKEIFYYLFGAFSLFFTIYLGIGWLIECAITKDVFLYHLMSRSNTTKFGFGIGVLFILPIGLFVANIYYRFTAFFIVFWSMHTLYFFKILDMKMSLKYGHNSSIFLKIFLWTYISMYISFAIGLISFFSFSIISLYYIFSCFIAWILTRYNIKWLWIFLLPPLLFTFSSVLAEAKIKFFIDLNKALLGVIN